MTYIGTKGFDNQSLVSSEDDKMRTYLALKHKKSLRIFEVTPITLSPYLEGFSHVVEKPRETGIEKSRDQKREAVADLVKAFGSKKKRYKSLSLLEVYFQSNYPPSMNPTQN